MKTTTLLTAIALATSMNVFAMNPTDAQITKIIETTNQGEINLAKLATEKTSNKEIKGLAEHMIMDHSSSNKKAEELVTKNKMTPEDSAKSREIKKTNETNMMSMKKLNGKEFDKAYLANQIGSHEKALKTYDEELIPSAKNADLKAMLISNRTKVENHLNHAKEINTSL